MSLAIVAILLLTGLVAYIRLSPMDPARWHADLSAPGAAALGASYCTTPTPGTRYEFTITDATLPLRVLQQIALSTPRTTLLAGSPEAGRISFVTRSALIGFPDVTTAQVLASANGPRLCLLARQRFGSEDFGVNAARLDSWAMQLEGRNEPPTPNPL